MALGSQILSSTLIIFAGTVFLVAVFIGVGLAVILSLIPTYLSSRDITPSGEQYCINNLRLNVTFNNSAIYDGIQGSKANDSYLLSQACYRILQNHKSDSLLTACLISNCNFTNTLDLNNLINSTDISCYAVVYYSARCSDQAATSGVNNTANYTTNSACRKQRLTNINAALGSSLVQFTNVPSLSVAGNTVQIDSIYNYVFSNYSQVGAYYCGLISQSAITTAVNNQATG